MRSSPHLKLDKILTHIPVPLGMLLLTKKADTKEVQFHTFAGEARGDIGASAGPHRLRTSWCRDSIGSIHSRLRSDDGDAALSVAGWSAIDLESADRAASRTISKEGYQNSSIIMWRRAAWHRLNLMMNMHPFAVRLSNTHGRSATSMSSVSYIMQSAVRTTSNRELAAAKDEVKEGLFMIVTVWQVTKDPSIHHASRRRRRTGSH